MRFGVMGMQIDALVPSGLTPAEAVGHIMSFDHAAMLRGMAGRGLNPLELGADLMLFFPQAFAPPAIQRLQALTAEMGVTYTVHLPLWSVEPSTLLTPVRQGSVRAVVDAIRATEPVQPEVYVLHATGALAAEFYRMALPPTVRDLIMQQFQQRARESIETILAETGLPSRRLAIETVEFPFELTLALADALDLSICLDTGHVLSGFSGPLDLFDALERALPRLAEIHLHDSPRHVPGQPIVYGQDHAPLGTGDLDAGRLIDRLEEAGFRGPIIFELRLDQALASLRMLHELRPQVIG